MLVSAVDSSSAPKSDAVAADSVASPFFAAESASDRRFRCLAACFCGVLHRSSGGAAAADCSVFAPCRTGETCTRSRPPRCTVVNFHGAASTAIRSISGRTPSRRSAFCPPGYHPCTKCSIRTPWTLAFRSYSSHLSTLAPSPALHLNSENFCRNSAITSALARLSTAALTGVSSIYISSVSIATSV